MYVPVRKVNKTNPPFEESMVLPNETYKLATGMRLNNIQTKISAYSSQRWMEVQRA